MAKRLWQVWTENEEESRKQGVIVNEKVVFSGTESACRRYAGKKKGLHLGYAPLEYMPESGDVWSSRVFAGIAVFVTAVNRRANVLRGYAISEKGKKRVMIYFYDQFVNLYEYNQEVSDIHKA